MHKSSAFPIVVNAVTCFLLLSLADVQGNERPIVGILSQPCTGFRGCNESGSYIASSYVKFVEMAGARVIPIIFNAPHDEIMFRMRYVHMLLFPGGAVPLQPGTLFFETSKSLFEHVIDLNKRGFWFPLHGTCLGFELLHILVARSGGVLQTFNSTNCRSKLNFTESARHSRLFQNFSNDLFEAARKKKIAVEHHMYGVSPEAYKNFPSLQSFFRILSTSADLQGKIYVSSMEAIDFPISGTQFHPEKPVFEWKTGQEISHDPQAILMAQMLSNALITEAKKNSRPPLSKGPQLNSLLIYNYSPIYISDDSIPFEQVYVFHTSSTPHPRSLERIN
ncbi:hypothetical protein GUITHDRAFT_72685 [Guillardia theta CCMP2712]|uniref:folate gamma-glutamyl hydrolase n=2 Tax=Guillardia theta TaxID=55529 RepID=L1J5Y8_GUITC|nr:hypothetical protein GUITHDRAFT_72685 [Guillardia theta CCMP2712]EKX43921.1 hypothetical protein GUITHDRAFT_72685 [Guillardia theta CCMP2712]|eukprot:XP_005830901.1 hypothetical protein GUITHDRAFT_72685 [Guillardia theta CCMP2712]